MRKVQHGDFLGAAKMFQAAVDPFPEKILAYRSLDGLFLAKGMRENPKVLWQAIIEQLVRMYVCIGYRGEGPDTAAGWDSNTEQLV
jgi:hypothetical protein